jgi:hypothetical protein
LATGATRALERGSFALPTARVTHVQISPVMIAVIVAVLGQAAILLNDFGPGNHQPVNDAVTVAAVRKAGAIDIPEGP